MDPDGALEYFLGFSLPILYTMLGELKNGGGDGGCDPSDQAQCAYIKLVSSKQYEHVRQVSCCPALLLSLSGHILAVWGAVFVDRFFFERLALIYLGPQPPSTLPSPTVGRSDIEVGIREVAKLLRTIEQCVQDIKSHYSSLDLQPTRSSTVTATAHSRSRPNASNSHPTGQSLSGLPFNSRLSKSPDPLRFVHWNSFTFKGNQYDLVYRQRLTSHLEKTVFLAAMSLPSDPNFREIEVVVKFALRYGEAGHHLLAEAGFAPRIHYCGFEESIGLWVIVMDYIQGTVCNRKLIEHEKDLLSSAIRTLHENNLVFGDLREPNVIITEPNSKVCLVDFEWCGPCIDIKEGDRVVQPQVRYPADISMGHGMDWAPGVGRDRVITTEHDIYRLSKM
ncbi:hypothetical protein GYMLUDRAFT_50897 [Collybiopsis luxurians FD-317 M1]|uniref:Protein kinase domain-containing protein n=1 Tax=Collybiopsis luxurians FD-317 M1 TaxID=944289 RepID=A0A0D0C868_9AGAR|nr:hypothetical protein GYMLUDRAFT_50897 [Collybiopsis luxurians FD-317 M1]